MLNINNAFGVELGDEFDGRGANHLAAGSSNERIRSYLADASKSTWRLVNWLPHAQDAGRFEGSLVTDATENVLESFLTALARYEASKQGLKKKRRGRQ